jgi:hypothetical protein
MKSIFVRLRLIGIVSAHSQRVHAAQSISRRRPMVRTGRQPFS